MAAAVKSKSASSNAGNKKTNPVTTNGTVESGSTAVESTASTEVSYVDYGSGKPDRALFDGEQEKIKADIDALRAKLNAVKDKLGLTTANGSGNDRRTQLRSELDAIRAQQSESKYSRTKVFDQLKQVQEGIQKKIKDLNAAKAKAKFKTVADVDDRINALQRQVDSGSMKLADEKRALHEISQNRRLRRTVESFQADQESIDRDKWSEEEIRKQLDDPEAKAVSERFDAIKAELDELKKEGDEAFANRSKLMDERTSLQAEMDALYAIKRESAQRFKDSNDRHWSKINEDRVRRAEKARLQRAAEEDAKKQELIGRLREEASAPAHQTEIEDCGTLIDYFSPGAHTPEASSTPSDKVAVVGVPELDIRKIDTNSTDGLVARRKKGQEEETYFVGAKSKKGKKGSTKQNGSSDSQLNIPLPTLSALLSLSIPPPLSASDVPRVVEDLKIKKTWFEANQTRVTRERIAKAEADIRKLTGGNKADATSPGSDASARLVNGEASAELTPQNNGALSTAVSSEVGENELEHDQEQEAADS